MDVLKVVLKHGEKLPESCWECKAIQGIPPKYLYCFDRHIDIDVYATRPSWCPLEVEEVCEWVKYDYVYYENPHNISPKLRSRWCQPDEFEFCPSCGKRIVYVESEEEWKID